MTIMNSLRMQLRFFGHLFKRKNAKMVRIVIILLVSICLAFVLVHQSGNLRNIEIPYMRTDPKQSPEHATGADAIFDPSELGPSASQHVKNSAKLHALLSETMEKIREFSPEEHFDRKNGKNCRIGDIHIDDAKSFDKLTKSELLKCINLPNSAKDEMKHLHKSFLQTLNEKILPSYKQGLYKGKGIVMVAGGKFTLIGMPAIKAIRENGDKNIPIEIMIPPDNRGESVFCEQILPELDPSGASRCVYMENLFDEKIFESVKGYQLKPLALLASSFEETLLLDADNYVVSSISHIFDASPFKQRGLVLWPDYWRRLHHPSLYDIAGLKIETDNQVRYSFDSVSPQDVYKTDEPNDAPFHDLKGTIADGSTESGQLLVNKSKHLDTIILSLYYNFNGPSHYYPLLGQSYAGEGDKDTFALASTVLHSNELEESYYQVKSPVGTMGHWTFNKDETLVLDTDSATEGEKQFRGVAMLQHDLESDFKALTEAERDLSTKYKQEFDKYREQKPHADNNDDFKDFYKEFWDAQRKRGYDLAEFKSYFKDVPVTFIHSHLPKFNPWEFGKSQDLTFDGKKVMERHQDEPAWTPRHHGHYRMYNDEFPKISDYDLELENWSCFEEFICKKEKGFQNFSYLKEQVESSQDGFEQYKAMCAYIKDRVKMLRSSSWTGR